jgi:glutathione S-transferase
MITLYTFGPAFGLPDPSPFVTKAHLLLKFAGQPYETNKGGYGKSPKGKLPYIDDGGEIVADSTFIRLHLEKKYGFEFDKGLDAERRAIAWAVEKMCDDHLYWIALRQRWLNDENFEKGFALYFKAAPAPIRPLVKGFIRARIRRDLRGHGMGRHTEAEIQVLADRACASIATILGDRIWIGGDRPCGADATVGAFVIGALCPVFDTAVGHAVRAHDNLTAYGERVMTRYFPQAVA